MRLLLPQQEPFLLPKNRGNIFEDSFDADRNGSVPSNWKEIGTNLFSILNGELITPDITDSSTILTDLFSSDCVAQMEYRRLTTSTRFASLKIRLTPDGLNGYTILVHAASSSIYINRTISGANTQISANTNYQNKDIESGILTAEMIGSTLRVFHNDRLALSVNDDTYKSGYMGVSCRASCLKWFRGAAL